MGLAQVLDLKPYAMKSLKSLIKDKGDEKLEQIEKDLNGEKDKIEMFKRELPISVQILSDVMDGIKEEIERRKREKSSEFTPPVKSVVVEDSGAEKQKDKSLDNKSNWMSSAQLWVDHGSSSSDTTDQDKISREGEEKGRKRPHQGAFTPFPCQFEFGMSLKREKQQQEDREQRVNKLSLGLPEFALVPPPPTVHVGGYAGIEMVPPVSIGTGAQRKARRCWSPELHRKFVAALGKLGGPQVATPKQIREFMKVDGLTNDEVKSHLQKYRLHNRRGPNANSSASGSRPMGLMSALRGLRGASSENGASSQLTISQSVSPQDPHQFSNGTGSTYEEEDARSESYNWK